MQTLTDEEIALLIGQFYANEKLCISQEADNNNVHKSQGYDGYGVYIIKWDSHCNYYCKGYPKSYAKVSITFLLSGISHSNCMCWQSK